MPKRFIPLRSTKFLNLMKRLAEMHVMSTKIISRVSTAKNMLALPSFQETKVASYVFRGGPYKCTRLSNYDKIQ